ncbi:MAG: hypothetical protein ACOCP4_00415 [Candidatus Woesearchaeota archaeon]
MINLDLKYDAKMKITIDTKKDSKKEVIEVIKLLKNVLSDYDSKSFSSNNEKKVNEGYNDDDESVSAFNNIISNNNLDESDDEENESIDLDKVMPY